jgi:hypothetical protein
MPPPVLAPLSYEAWVVRRTSANGLRVLYAAVAAGPGDVLVPLPWPEVRLLDENPSWALVWKLDVLVTQWRHQHSRRPFPAQDTALVEVEKRKPPAVVSGGRVVARAELPAGLTDLLHPTWGFAQYFVWWPALPAPRGLSAWLPWAKYQHLAPIALAIEGGSLPFRTQGERLEISLASTSEVADLYLIDAEQLVTLPAGGFNDPFCGSGFSLPGLVTPGEHFHWSQSFATPPHANLKIFQRHADAARQYFEEREKSSG